MFLRIVFSQFFILLAKCFRKSLLFNKLAYETVRTYRTREQSDERVSRKVRWNWMWSKYNQTQLGWAVFILSALYCLRSRNAATGLLKWDTHFLIIWSKARLSRRRDVRRLVLSCFSSFGTEHIDFCNSRTIFWFRWMYGYEKLLLLS